MSSGFSGVLKLTDLDDFIAPGQECIKPIEGKKDKLQEPSQRLSKIKVELEDDGTYSQIKDGNATVLEKVSITLSDCLACSGCITSAESILVSQQGPDELLRILEHNLNSKSTNTHDEHICIVTLGVQAVLSMAHKYDLDPQVAAECIAGFFIHCGADKVTMSTLGEDFSLLESQKEFEKIFDSNKSSLPVLTGICPGWVCYGEKLHTQSLPYISKVKSPQQIMGSLIKSIYAPSQNLTPDQITHITLMSCFDRKLEASRLDFSIPEYRTREVDHVVTAIEVEEILRRFQKSLHDYSPYKLANLFPECGDNGGSVVKSHLGSGSGGYAEFVLRAMSLRLTGKVPQTVTWQQGRNSDIWEASLSDDTGKVLLKFGIATGFRNIQTIVRKLKSKVMVAQLPHYIEIMACPTGCLNGGAQVRPEDNALVSRDLAAKLEKDYHQLPIESELIGVERLYEMIVTKFSEIQDRLFYTNYHGIEKTEGLFSSSVKW